MILTAGRMLEGYDMVDTDGSIIISNSFTYDENGIRTSKTVNGVTTDFNTLGGVVLAQKTGTNIMYFQYDSAGAPIGFVYNDVQYLYITNLSGDVLGIMDAQGNPIAAYTYDAWGKLLDITTAEENNEEQLALANANPLRYRGYYYDSETGYYYLQSRYYNPEWGRFISADSFAYLDTENSFSLNAYIYCWNCPTIFEDKEGTTPTISIDISKIQAFAVKLQAFISNGKDKLTDFGNRILASLQNTIDRFKQFNEKIKCKFTEWGEKANFYIENPYVFFKDSVAKIFKRDLDTDLKQLKNRIRHILFGEPLQFEYTNPTFASKGIKNSDDNPYVSEAGKSIVDIILTLFILDDLSINMLPIFKTDLTSSFFTLINITALVFPSIYNVILDIFKNDKLKIWDVISGKIKDTINVQNAVPELAIVFTDIILKYAKELTFIERFASWSIGFLPAELALLVPGIIMDESLTTSQKVTLVFVDAFSIILSNAISTAISFFDVAGPIKAMVTVGGMLLPILVDIITKIIMKKE